jgi:hypothetical protein
VLVALWRVPLALVGASIANWEAMGVFTVTLAMGLSVLWLLGDWLARRRVWTALLASLCTMAAVVALSYQTHYERAWRSDFPILIACGVSGLALVGAFAMAGFSCRRTYTTVRLLSWLALWTWVVFAALALVGISIQALMINPLLLPAMLLMGLLMSLFGAGGLFLLVLPFLILSFRCPFYRERLEGALRLRQPSGHSPEDGPTGESPFAGPVGDPSAAEE